jgi:hypothetical protein
MDNRGLGGACGEQTDFEADGYLGNGKKEARVKTENCDSSDHRKNGAEGYFPAFYKGQSMDLTGEICMPTDDVKKSGSGQSLNGYQHSLISESKNCESPKVSDSQ